MMKCSICSELISNVNCIHSMIVRIDCNRNRQLLLPFIAKYWEGNTGVCGRFSRALSVSQNKVASLVQREGSSNTENDIVVLPGKAEDVVDDSVNVSAIDKWYFKLL